MVTERTSPKAGGEEALNPTARHRDRNCVRRGCSGGRVEGFGWAEGACARAWAPPPMRAGQRLTGAGPGVGAGRVSLALPNGTPQPCLAATAWDAVAATAIPLKSAGGPRGGRPLLGSTLSFPELQPAASLRGQHFTRIGARAHDATAS